jgi:DNA polymerase-3 subunit chi
VLLFYHIQRSDPFQTARAILRRALDQGWRVVVRSPDPQGLDALDRALWLDPEEEFLPHGRAGGPHDAHQPILLAEGPGRANGADTMLALEPGGVDLDEARALRRVWILFDAADPAAVEAARALWRRAKDARLAAEYWTDAEGRWAKKQESVPGPG